MVPVWWSHARTDARIRSAHNCKLGDRQGCPPVRRSSPWRRGCSAIPPWVPSPRRWSGTGRSCSATSCRRRRRRRRTPALPSAAPAPRPAAMLMAKWCTVDVFQRVYGAMIKSPTAADSRPCALMRCWKATGQQARSPMRLCGWLNSEYRKHPSGHTMRHNYRRLPTDDTPGEKKWLGCPYCGVRELSVWEPVKNGAPA